MEVRSYECSGVVLHTNHLVDDIVSKDDSAQCLPAERARVLLAGSGEDVTSPDGTWCRC